MAEVSVSKAARMTGKGRSTIQRHIKDGKLSAGKDAAGSPVIDVSELIRVYGAIKADEADKPDLIRQIDTAEPDQTAQAVIETLREELRAAREREEWLKERIEVLEQRALPPAGKPGFFRRLFGG